MGFLDNATLIPTAPTAAEEISPDPEENFLSGSQMISSPTDTATKTPDQNLGRLATFAEIALPVGGAAIGGLFGGGIGAPIGAGAGRAIYEAGRQVLDPNAPPILPEKLSFEERAAQLKKETPTPRFSALENVMLEVGGEVVGERLIKRFIKTPLAKSIRKGLSKATIKGKSYLGANAGKLLDSISERIPAIKKNEYYLLLANKFKAQLGIPEEATIRVLQKGAKNILTPKNFSKTKKGNLNRGTINKVASVSNRAFNSLRQQFDNQIKPVLSKNKDIIDIEDTIAAYDNSINEITSISKKSTILPSAEIDKANAFDLQAISNDLNTLKTTSTPLKLHKFKQKLNRVIGKKSIQDVPSAKNTIIGLKNNISNTLNEIIPQYKAINNDFRFLFSIEDEIGTKFTPKNVESLLKQVFNPDKESLRQSLELFVSKTPEAKNILEEALDERTALFFRDTFVGGQGGLPLPTVKVGTGGNLGFFEKIPTVLGGTSTPRKVGETLLKREARKTLSPKGARFMEKALKGAVGEFIAQPIRKLGE